MGPFKQRVSRPHWKKHAHTGAKLSKETPSNRCFIKVYAVAMLKKNKTHTQWKLLAPKSVFFFLKKNTRVKEPKHGKLNPCGSWCTQNSTEKRLAGIRNAAQSASSNRNAVSSCKRLRFCGSSDLSCSPGRFQRPIFVLHIQYTSVNIRTVRFGLTLKWQEQTLFTSMQCVRCAMRWLWACIFPRGPSQLADMQIVHNLE